MVTKIILRFYVLILRYSCFETGSAAIHGLRSKSDVSIFVLHPNRPVCPLPGKPNDHGPRQNVHNLEVEATFDNCQVHISEDENVSLLINC